MARRQTPSKKTQTVAPSRLQRRARLLIIVISLTALIWSVFGQTLGHEFVNFDDQEYVYENPQVIRGLSIEGLRSALTQTVSYNWHPLTVLSHMLDVEIFGLHPGWHHFTNVVLHTTAALLLFGFLIRTTRAIWRSAFVAAVFAIHPLRVESVAWVAERKDVLSGVFFMLTLGAYERYVRQPSTGRYVVVAGVFACGLMAKPMLVTVPLVLLLLDYWPLQRGRPLHRLALEKLPLIALSAGAALIALLTQTPTIKSIAVLSIERRVGNAILTCLTYIGQMFWPVKLAAFYPHPMDLLEGTPVAVALLVLLLITGAAVWFGRARPYLAVGWLWYLVMLVPVLGIVQVGAQGHADRYTYLPQIGLYVMLAWGFAELLGKWRYGRIILASASAFALAALATSAWAQTAVWHDSEKLWRHAISVTKYNYLAHRNLGQYLGSKQRIAEAIPHYQEALAIAPNNAEMHNRVGLWLTQNGKPSEAVAHWKKALEVDPADLNAQSNLAWVFATCPEPSMRDGARAVEFAENVVARSGTRTPILLRTLAAAYAEVGRYTDATAITRDAIELANGQGDRAFANELEALARDFQLEIPLRDGSLANLRPVTIR